MPENCVSIIVMPVSKHKGGKKTNAKFDARVKFAFRLKFTRYFLSHRLLIVGHFNACWYTLTRWYKIPGGLKVYFYIRYTKRWTFRGGRTKNLFHFICVWTVLYVILCAKSESIFRICLSCHVYETYGIKWAKDNNFGFICHNLAG